MNDARRQRTRVSTYHRTTELDEIATSRARNTGRGRGEDEGIHVHGYGFLSAGMVAHARAAYSLYRNTRR